VRYLLDTNVFIAAMKGNAGVRGKLELTPAHFLALSPVVLGELQLGVEKSVHPEKNAQRLMEVVSQIELIPLDADVSRYYASIRADLEQRGTSIGANDYWIAAQALAIGAAVVTDNEAEFRRVPELRVDNWLDDAGSA
jgi:tRNA(fMet)-specific endonuclease VapC